MRLNAVYCCGLMLVALMVACGEDKTSPFDTDMGPRQSVFVPTSDVTLTRQFYSGINTREQVVVQSATDWSRAWARIHATQSPAPAIVQPDFNTEVVLLAAMGEKPAGGYTVTIDSVTRHERGSIVYVTEKSPGESCFTPAVMTQAVHAIRASRGNNTFSWRTRSIVENC